MGGKRRIQSGALADFVSAELVTRADPTKAEPMAAYMKTDMPFYGVQKAGRVEVIRAAATRFEVRSGLEYGRVLQSLWERPHREEKYIALALARRWKRFVTSDHLEMYVRWVREGSWWDLVDEIAANLIGQVWMNEREMVSALADAWVDDDDVWIRRVSIIGQLKHRGATDAKRLFRYCTERAHEKEFFIRKAIGWALREYSKHNPGAVRAFIDDNGDRLSGLSIREGSRKLPSES